MAKAIATFGSGPSARLLELSLPVLRQYAELHGYEVVIGLGDARGRPSAWGKVPFLRELLTRHEFVLWLDADTLILDPSVDVESVVPVNAFQAFAVAQLASGKGRSPLTGVWALRAGQRSQSFLAEVWQQDDLIAHRLWEQAAFMRLLGWTTELPFTQEEKTDWDNGSHVLDEEWNMVPQLPIGYRAGRIRHYAGWTNRRRELEMKTDLALLHGNSIRYRLGLLERRFEPIDWPITAAVRDRARALTRGTSRSR